MENKKYSIIKNALWPFKSTIEIGSDSISLNKKTIKWQEIDHFCCHIISVNNGMNYIITLVDKNKNSIKINLVHNMLAAKAKKELFAEIFDRALDNITKHHILAKTEYFINEIKSGKEVKIAGVLMSSHQVEISKGLIKKEKLTLPLNMIKIVSVEGTGGYRVSSKSNEKDFQHIPYADLESRYLLQVLTKLTT